MILPAAKATKLEAAHYNPTNTVLMALLLVVFAIELLCYIVLSIGSKPINNILWQLYQKTPFGTSKDYQDQVRLRREVVGLKRDMAGISAQDDFARWAKIRRKHDKTLEDYDKKGMGLRRSSDILANRCQRPLCQRLDLPSMLKPPSCVGRVQEGYSLDYNSGTPRHPCSHTLGVGSHGRSNGFWASLAVHMGESVSTSGATLVRS